MKKYLLLLLSMVLSSISAMAEVKVTKVTDIDAAVENGTVVNLCIGDQYLYGSNNQNTAMGDANTAKSSSNGCIGYKIEKVDNGYMFRCVTPDGGDYFIWGRTEPNYLNAQPTVGGVTFNLNNGTQRGTDMKNGAVWTIDSVGIKNVGNGGYFAGTSTSADPVAVSIVKIEADPEPEPDPIVIPESLKPFISNQTVFTLKSGDSYVYGSSQQNLNVGTWEQASSSENNANGYVLENDDYYFYLRAVKADGSNISAWGTNPCWLNNNGANVVFNMGKDQDKKNGSSWKIAELEDGKYTIESINQPGKYLAVNGEGNGGTLSETAAAWEFFVATTITVDNANFVQIMNENREYVSAGLVSPGNYMIQPNSEKVGDYKLYQVKVNNEDKTPVKGANYYMLEIAKGDKVEVISQYPDSAYMISFSDAAAIDSITSNGKKVAIKDGVAAVTPGYKVIVTLNEGYTSENALAFYATANATITTVAPAAMAVVTVDNASKVQIMNENRENLTVVAGAQQLSAGYYMVSPTGDYKLNQVTLNGETINTVKGATYYMVELAANDTLAITADYAVESFNVTFSDAAAIDSITSNGKKVAIKDGVAAVTPGYKVIVTLNEGYTSENALAFYATANATITTVAPAAMAVVTVDNASKVQIMNENREYLTVIAGAQQFSAGYYMVSPTGDYKLNQVTLNGETINPANGATYYMVELAANDTLAITADYAVESFNVTFSDAAAIDSITSNGKKVAINEGVAAVVPGYKVVVTLNEGYTSENALAFYATADATITTVAPAAMAVVTVDNASKVQIMNENREYLTVVAGAQQLSAGNYIVSTTGDYKMNKVTLNGETINPANGATYYMVELAANDTLAITADYEVATYDVIFSDVNAIDSVTVAGTKFEITDGKIAAPAGYKVIVTLNEGYTSENALAFYATAEATITTAEPFVPVLPEGYVAITDLTNFVGVKVILMNVKSGEFVYGTNAQNTGVSKDWATASAESNSVTSFELGKEEVVLDSITEQTATVYTFKAITPAGANYGIWGANPSYLNSQPGVGGVSFILGKNQDTENGSSWYLNWSDALQAYGVVNVANGGYLAGTTIQSAENYWVIACKQADYDTATGINAVATETVKSGKFIKNGKIVIVRNGKTYDLNGLRK